MRYLTLALFILLLLPIHAEFITYDKVIKNNKANSDYKKGQLEDAAEKYQENAIQYPEDGLLHYNLGNSLYKQEKLDEAKAEYEEFKRNLMSKQREN